MSKPKVAVYKFSSCDGCQLSLLNLEDELLDLADAFELAYFLEATSRVIPGPYDIALVEGSISTPHEIERIKEVRRQARYLIALGTCSTSGGIQALRNFVDADDLAQVVYPHPDFLSTLKTSSPASDYIQVDLELWGCPVNKYQVLEVLAALLDNRKPVLPTHCVCLDCKRNSTTCVLVARSTACLGPVTRSGCNAICPGIGRGCYGCFGPAPDANLTAMVPLLQEVEAFPGETAHLLRSISANAPRFRQAVDRLGQGVSRKESSR
jgi:coenzyme F420-reducing hydrogenase gamma subunit